MKNRNIWWGCAVFTVMLTSCDKWFDVKPQTEIRQEALFSSDKGFYNALTGVYLHLSDPELYGAEMQYAAIDVLAQNYAITNTTGGGSDYLQAVMYDWAGSRKQFDPIWTRAFEQIANCNNILKNLEGKESLFPSGNYQILKAETKALRAFLHFDMLRLFAPSPSSGEGKKAIPYVDAISKIPFPQLTVKEVLSRVIVDLKEAYDLLKVYDPYFTGIENGEFDFMTDNGFRQDREARLNYYGVAALLARVWLYAGDKQEALGYAKEVIGRGYQFTSQENINGMSVTVFYTEIISGVYLKSALFKKQSESWFSTKAGNSALRITNESVENLFEVRSLGSTDLRYKNQFGMRQDENEKFLNKYFAGSIFPLIRLSEVYYIAAESASTRKEAFGYLNEVRRNRVIPELDYEDSSIDLDNELYKEYRKDFLGEGQLFFYLKRKNKPSFIGINGTEISNAGDHIYVVPVPDLEKEFGSVK